MSYNCKCCKKHVSHGQPMRRHTVYRQDRSILREIPVCRECGDKLALGVQASTPLRQTAPKTQPVPQPVPTPNREHQKAQRVKLGGYRVESTPTSIRIVKPAPEKSARNGRKAK